MLPVHAVILAAGQGTRMKSALPKVLHAVGGRPMLAHVLDTARDAGVTHCHVVHGHGADAVRAHFAASSVLHWAQQAQQRGTAHALGCALPQLPDAALVLVLYGDVPLIEADTLRALCAAGADGLALVTVEIEEPRGYGRILRDKAGCVSGIVEENEASEAQRAIREINTGLLAAPVAMLRHWLAQVRDDNSKREFYLTDVVALAAREGVAVQTVPAASADEVQGVNDRVQLARVERVFQHRQAEALMRAGVTLADPARFDLRGRLRHGRDVFIDVGAVLEGEIELGDEVKIGPYAILKNVKLGDGCEVLAHSVLEGLSAGRAVRIGPFARVRPHTVLADEVHIGNFVEIKKSALGAGTKAGHLAYLGDAQIGADVNISAGVITCNYDGANKHVTVIGDGAFVGTDTQLVAPVTVEAGAYIAAGSTITKAAPADALTICRAREQRSYPGWKKPRAK